MTAKIKHWEVKELGPAFETRTEYPDGSIGYDGVSEVTLTFVVKGDINATGEFLDTIRRSRGRSIMGLDFGPDKKRNQRQYVFDE